MPAALPKDWKTAESLYFQGVLPSVISKDLDIPLSTLSQRITRQGWAKRKQSLSKEVGTSIEERAKSWRLLAIDAVDRFFQALRALPKSRLDKLQRQDVQNLKDLVETGLKAYGLDKEAASARITIGLYSGQSGASMVPGCDAKQAQVIDVQGVTAEASSASQAQSGVDAGQEEK
jgi:hypothetical protein